MVPTVSGGRGRGARRGRMLRRLWLVGHAGRTSEHRSLLAVVSSLVAHPPPVLPCPEEPNEYVQPSVNHQLNSEFVVSSGEDVVNNTLQPSIDPAAVLQSVKATGVQALASAPAELRGDREFMLSVAVCFPLAEVMPFFTDELRVQLCADRCFMQRAIQEVGSGILAEASLELRGDREFMLAAASCCEPRIALKYASNKLMLELCADRSFMDKAVQQVGTAVLAHASADLRADQEFIMSAATWQPAADALNFASKKLRDELSSNHDFMLKVVQQAGPAYLANISVKLRGDKDFMLSIAMVFPRKGVMRYATKELRAELYADRTFVVKAVQYSGLPELLHASLDLRKDREFMLALAAHYPLADVLHYTTDQFRLELYGDHFFMLRLLEEIGATELERASEELRGNRDFMSAAEACCPVQEVLRCCTSGLRNVLCGDRKFMLKAVKEAGAGMLENATSELRADLGFMMQISGFCPAGEALRYISEELRNELDKVVANAAAPKPPVDAAPDGSEAYGGTDSAAPEMVRPQPGTDVSDAATPAPVSVPCWNPRRRACFATQADILHIDIDFDWRGSCGTRVSVEFFGTECSDDVKQTLADRGYLKDFLRDQDEEYLTKARLLFGNIILSPGIPLKSYKVKDRSVLRLAPLTDSQTYTVGRRALSPASQTRLDAAYRELGPAAAAALVAAAQQTSPMRIPSPPQLPAGFKVCAGRTERVRQRHASDLQQQQWLHRDLNKESRWKPRQHRHTHGAGSNTDLSTVSGATLSSLGAFEDFLDGLSYD